MRIFVKVQYFVYCRQLRSLLLSPDHTTSVCCCCCLVVTLMRCLRTHVLAKGSDIPMGWGNFWREHFPAHSRVLGIFGASQGYSVGVSRLSPWCCQYCSWQVGVIAYSKSSQPAVMLSTSAQQPAQSASSLETVTMVTSCRLLFFIGVPHHDDGVLLCQWSTRLQAFYLSVYLSSCSQTGSQHLVQ